MKRAIPKKTLVLGSSALKIGEAGEFDYSGSQAIKALQEEGVEVVLINPNIATVQTSEGLADHVYFLPITPEFVQRVIEREKPDSILLGFGGQTALNCGLRLDEFGALNKHNVRVLGAPLAAVRDSEDRERFTARLDEIDVKTPAGRTATSVEGALDAATSIGYPVMMRVGFALGGLGSGVCRDEQSLRELASRALAHAPQVLIEEYLEGWKEIEYEVMRDVNGNCIIICNMENLDPLGIHTGESVVVAPSQTLTNHEYHKMREIATKVISHLGIIGECNIQYALDPIRDDYRVIEVNARLSRSSALASKATGYPIAFVAAKLALGYGMHELTNRVTGVTTAFFEPSLDYVVVKAPRWDLKKFRNVSRQIGSRMKSVGEVMAIGRSFEEAVQKAMRMLDTGEPGLIGGSNCEFDDLERELAEPTEERLFAVAHALTAGWNVDAVHKLSHIDRWFLERVANIVRIGARLQERGSATLNDGELLGLGKRTGFSDVQIAALAGVEESDVQDARVTFDLHPVIRRIDTLAAEYPARTNYLYLTYHGEQDEYIAHDENGVMVLGSGAYRIGSSVEFDWCCVNTVRSLREMGETTIVVNCNPETVSTDYDESDYLFFEEITVETISEIHTKMAAQGVIVSMGGQTPNTLAMKLDRAGVRVLGTSAVEIDRAEDRHKFSSLLDSLGVDQPPWREVASIEDACEFAQAVGYPALVRPSYVLSGAAMAVASNDVELTSYLAHAAKVSPEHPIVISKYLRNAKEIEFDAIADDGEIVVYAISEHVENAGVHSGDATLVFPPQRMYLETVRQIRRISKQIATELQINGPLNIQFIAKDNEVKVIECNLRASRSFPFVSKILRQNFIDIATRVIMQAPYKRPAKEVFELNHVGVKAPQFSFARLDGADPTLGVEMASTGEVGCIGEDFNEAFLKSLMSVGYQFPIHAVLFSVGSIEAKADLLKSARQLRDLGVKFFATPGTARFLRENDIETKRVCWPLDDVASENKMNAVELLRRRKVDIVINIPHEDREEELTNGYAIRRAAVDFNVPLITNRQLAVRLAEALSRTKAGSLAIRSWGEYATVG